MCNLNKPKTWCLFLGVNNTWIYTRCHRTFLRTWMCFVQHQLVRYVGLRQSPFLIGQLNLNGYMARFVVKIEYQKGNCVGEIGLKGSKYISCSRFHNLEGLYDHLNLHVDLQGWDDKLQDSQLLSKWGKFPIWYSAQNRLWSWKLPTIGPNTLRYVDFMWSLFLIRHLYFEWYMARFQVKNAHQNDMRYDEIGLFAQNIDNILVSNVNTIWRAYVITQTAIIES